MRGTPWDYVQKCQDALCVIDGGEAPPRWSLGNPYSEAPEEEAICSDPDFPCYVQHRDLLSWASLLPSGCNRPSAQEAAPSEVRSFLPFRRDIG
jgi:hypothetical protein